MAAPSDDEWNADDDMADDIAMLGELEDEEANYRAAAARPPHPQAAPTAGPAAAPAQAAAAQGGSPPGLDVQLAREAARYRDRFLTDPRFAPIAGTAPQAAVLPPAPGNAGVLQPECP